MRRRPGRDTQFPIQHRTALNSANGRCLIHVSKVHEATSSYTAVASARSPRQTATPPSTADLPESPSPDARCCRCHLPWPYSTDRPPFEQDR
jgi:hypothetical protein